MWTERGCVTFWKKEGKSTHSLWKPLTRKHFNFAPESINFLATSFIKLLGKQQEGNTFEKLSNGYSHVTAWPFQRPSPKERWAQQLLCEATDLD